MLDLLKGKKKDKKEEKKEHVVIIESTKSQGSLQIPPPPAVEDIKQQFSQLLYELGVPESKRAEMEAWTNDKKWILLIQNKDKIKDNEEKMKQKGSLYETPQFYLSLLRENTTNKKLMSDLRVCLASNTMSWINNFLSLGGFIEVLKIFQTFQLKQDKDQSDYSILIDCISCIKSLLNSQAGIKSVMTTSHTFKVLILCLDTTYPAELRNLVLQLTAALTLLPQVGHSFVLEAIDNFKNVSREKSRFSTIIEGVKLVAKTQIQYEYMTSFMTFVNSIVNSPVDLQVRVALRAEFTALKLIELIKPCKGIIDDLDTQINVFFECLEEDSQEIDSHYTEVNIRSPTEVATKLEQLLTTHPAIHHHFLSIIRGLYTLASTQSDLGGTTWNLLDESVSIILKDPTRESQIEKLRAENTRLVQELETFTKLAKITGDSPISTSSIVSSVSSQSPLLLSNSTNSSNNDSIIEDLESKLQISNNEKSQYQQKLVKLENEVKTLVQNNSTLESKINVLETKISTLESTSSSSTTPDSGSSTSAPAPPPPPSTTAPPPPPPPPPAGAPPPPPPPPPAGGPPPPPPPPGGGPPPPPPPGGMMKKAAPAGPNVQPKKVVIPSVKMVGLQWKKVNNNQIDTSIWSNAKDYNIGDEVKGLEELFQVKKPTATPTAGSAAPGGLGGSVKAPAAQTISILDIKRSQAISIMLSRFKISFADLTKAISNFDETKLSLEDAKSLLKFVPTPEEIELLKEEDISQLGKPEQFLYELSKVNRLSEKLECFIFKQKMASQIEELTPDIQALQKASTEMKNNKNFHKILEIILSLGNFINGGTNRGEVHGFKLDSLMSLFEVRSPVEPKLTLATWLIQLFEKKHPELVNFYDSLACVDDAKRISIQTLRSEVASLKKGLSQISNEVSSSEGPSKTVLSNFVSKSTDSVNNIDKQFTQAIESFNQAVVFYGEDAKTANPEEFFTILSRFKNEFKRAYETIQKDKELANKAAARKLAASSKPAPGSPSSNAPQPRASLSSASKPTIVLPVSNNNNNNNSGASGGHDDDDEQPNQGAFMDSLLNSMRGGQAIKLSRRASQYVSLQPNQGALDALNVALKNKK
ncbi:hypothetical protein CYY_002388 [Polysphondylium violaceum]|uniref:Actin binding protein n=1 Tax=Polysphondylium violaceum TaxID=133409 RepID=A0A8J4Q1E2_9MYCE|nr:hypothetical protein CYY_002388 [Polysphondylium violaceum]